MGNYTWPNEADQQQCDAVDCPVWADSSHTRFECQLPAGHAQDHRSYEWTW